MPIYEYVCQKCDRVFEEFIVRSDDLAAVACPFCRARKVEKVMSRPAARSAQGGGGSQGTPGCGPVG